MAVTSACAGILILFFAGFTIWNVDFTHKRLDSNLLTIGTVQEGAMDVKINATGILLPRKVEWLSSEVDGQVKEVVVLPGDRVAPGQLVVRLENPQLRASAEEAESQLQGFVAEQVSFAVELENQVLNQQAVTLAAKFAYKKEQLQEEAERQLIETGIIPEIQYRKTQLNVMQMEQIYEIEQQRLQRKIDNRKTLLAVKDAKIQQAKSAVERAKSRVAALEIRAGIDGVVQELPLEIGQRVTLGTKLGQIANQETLYAQLRVAARQASEIAVGQHVTVDTRNGIVEGTLSRVDPAASEGLVTVEVNLEGKLPKGARPELPVEGTIFVSQIESTLFVNRPTYARSNAQLAVYRFDEDGLYAHRTGVVFGKLSVTKAQILSGLEVGDKIILSDSSTWQDHDSVMLN